MSVLDNYTKTGAPVEDTKLTRFSALCAGLKNPQTGLKYIHIAGTNGKGSTAEYISRALEHAGFKTGKFTSPFIVNVRERLQINGGFIPEKEFQTLLKKADNAAKKSDFTGFSQFEILTAAAFLWFKQQSVDYVVLETGIGGLLDCTNIISADDLQAAAISAIALDHCELLGITVDKIAAHKAGIIKENRPVVTAAGQSAEALTVIRKVAEARHAPLIIPGNTEQTQIYLQGNDFVYKGLQYHSQMGGRHQVQNALIAIEVLHLLKIDSEHIISGVYDAKLPARMCVSKQGNITTIIDGAHNPQGIAAGIALLEPESSDAAVTIVFGMTRGKDYIGALKLIFGSRLRVNSIVFTDGFSENAILADDLRQMAEVVGFPPEKLYTVSNAQSALSCAVKLAEKTVFVTGSLYLASSLQAAPLLT